MIDEPDVVARLGQLARGGLGVLARFANLVELTGQQERTQEQHWPSMPAVRFAERGVMLKRFELLVIDFDPILHSFE